MYTITGILKIKQKHFNIYTSWIFN